MSFNGEVKSSLENIFEKHGYYLINDQPNIIEFSNEFYSFVLSHNVLENSFSFWYGECNKQKMQLNDELIEVAFGNRIKINNLPFSTFLNNIQLLLLTYEDLFFVNNEVLITRLQEEFYKRINKYNLQVHNRHYLDKANKAWLNKNYNAFIEAIEQMDLDTIAKSYALKYEYAKKQESKNNNLANAQVNSTPKNLVEKAFEKLKRWF